MKQTLMKKTILATVMLLLLSITNIPTFNTQTPILEEKNKTTQTYTNPTDPGTLSGYVTDTTMNPIMGATIRVYFHGTMRENTSDATGYYHVTDIPICNCTKNTTCSKEGYTTAWVYLTIWENTTHDFVLKSKDQWFYVGGTGPGNYSRIQDAIDNASTNDTIFVFNDSSPYPEFLTINRPIHLRGEEKKSTIIDGSSQSKIVVTITADHVHLSNFTIINYGDEAISVTANHTTISNNIIGPNISGWSGNGIRLLYANNNSIFDNEIAHTFDSIQVFHSHYNRIHRNYIKSSWLYGIWLSESTRNYIGLNMIDTGSPVGLPGSYIGIRLTSSNDNYVCDNGLLSWDEDCVTGMMLWESTNNYVLENYFMQCGFAWYGSYENVVVNNSVNTAPLIYQIGQSNLDITSAGQIVLIQCNNSTVHDVQISNTPKAIDLMLSDTCRIHNCTCVHNEYGINIESSPKNEVTNNAIIDNEHGIYIGDKSTHTVVTNNTVQDSVYLGIYSNAAFTYIEHNHIHQNTQGIMVGGIFALQNKIIQNTVTDNYNGIVLCSLATKVSHNQIATNINGINIECGSSLNHITSNEIIGNAYGVNITYAPLSRRSISNWIQKNNFKNNTIHALFDSSLRNHWMHNYWEGDWLPPHCINGMHSFYKVHPWTGAIIWEKHIPWIAFDWIPALKSYDILGMIG